MSWTRKQGDSKKHSNRNFVAKHAHKVSKATTFVDRKRKQKTGYTKHKTGWSE